MRQSISLYLRVVAATIAVATPPILFEKLTYYYYSIASHAFGGFSVDRFWFDIMWFCLAGAIPVVLLGRDTKAVIIPPLLGSLIFIVTAYVTPLCTIKECYVSSIDGLAPLRDFLLFASLSGTGPSASMKTWDHEDRSSPDITFGLGATMLMGFALSFFPVVHIFAGVSAQYPLNYLQWFLAGAPAGLAGSMWMLDREPAVGIVPRLLAGLAGVILAICLAVELPCENCSGYPVSVLSIILLAGASCAPALVLGIRRPHRTPVTPPKRFSASSPAIITAATIVVTTILLLALFFTGSYLLSVVNDFSGVSNSAFSPIEVGHTFVYSGGYLPVTRIVSESVGINVSFGNTSISQSKYPGDFLAAGVGDQSPNCCKDGLDLAYRADVIDFTNGTEAVLARAWWACDYIMACGGYSWQQLLHIGSSDLPAGTLSNWTELEMNWTSSHEIRWFYRIHYKNNGTATRWILYDSYTPPKIENHYWDAHIQ